LIYAVITAVLWVAGLLLVPAERFRLLLPFGLLAGFGLAAIINLMGSSVMGLWEFHRTGLLAVRGVPLMALLAWVPVVIVFVRFLPQAALPRLAWLLAFPLGYTALEYLLLRLGARSFAAGWNLEYSFALSLAVHVGVLAWYRTIEPERLR